jgi:hypothetical protein
MIDLTKQYRTRDGRPVTNLREAVKDDGFTPTYTIVGYINGESKLHCWLPNGKFITGDNNNNRDLVEVQAPKKAPVPLDLTKPIQTYGADPVEIITIEGRGQYPIVGYIADSKTPSCWTREGLKQHGASHPLDLMNVPPARYVGYVNIYPNKVKFLVYPSRAEADQGAGTTRIACVRVEYKEGQFDD